MSAKYEQTELEQSADFYSDVINLEDHSMFAAQCNVANGDTFTGTVTLQVTNDFDNWVDVATASALSGTSDSQLFDAVQSSAGYARLSIVVTTGSADFNIDWVLK